MACGHCKARVEKALLSLEGVIAAEANPAERNVKVQYDENKVSPLAMKTAVENAGYRFHDE